MGPGERMPTVFVIIVHLNGKTLLAECLNSLRKVDYPPYEVIVVDNGSSDGSRDFLRASYPGVKLIENATNLGFGGGNNLGIRYALGKNPDYLLLLNNDTLVDPSFLRELIAVAEEDPKIGIAGPKIYYDARPEKIWFAGGAVNLFAGLIRHRGIRKMDRGQYDEIEEVDYITGCCLLIKREVITHLGTFDPIYDPAYYEDVDLCLRAKSAGYRVVFVPRAKVWHKISASGGGEYSSFKIYLKTRNYFKLLKIHTKFYHRLMLPILAPPVWIGILSRELLNGRFHVLGAVIKGLLALAKRSRISRNGFFLHAKKN